MFVWGPPCPEKNWMLGQNVDNVFQRIIYIWLHFSNIALIVNVKRSDFYEMSWWCVRSIAKVCTHYFVILPQAHIIIPITWCLLYFPDHMSRQVTRGPGQSLSLVWVSPRPLIGHCPRYVLQKSQDSFLIEDQIWSPIGLQTLSCPLSDLCSRLCLLLASYWLLSPFPALVLAGCVTCRKCLTKCMY